jgi:predicted AlkP superfamily phosphohydrolase/phosphomutase
MILTGDIMSKRKSAQKPVYILGLDGATWSVIDPLMKKGLLPNFSTVIQGGVHGSLMSIEPYFSPMVWTSIATGKLPEKHGIRHFFNKPADLKTKRIWNIVEDAGGRVGIIGWLVTWPPERVNGFMVPDWLSRDSRTHPETLMFLKELERSEKLGKKSSLEMYSKYMKDCLQHGVRWGTLINAILLKAGGRWSDNARLKKKFLRQRIYRDVFVQQLKKFNTAFSALLVPDIDSVSHRYWKYMEPEKFKHVGPDEIRKYGDVIQGAYVEADRTLGEFIKLIKDGGILVVVSDHGFKASEISIAFESINTDALLKKLNMPEIESVANFGNKVYIYPRHDADIDSVINKLQNVTIKEKGSSVFNIDKMDKQNIANISVKKFQEDVEHCTVNFPGAGCLYRDIINKSSSVDITGIHAPEGIFMMMGENIKRGLKVENITVLDIVPTILPILGIPVGKDMDGRIIGEVFTKEPDVTFIDSHDSSFQQEEEMAGADSPDEEEELKEKLKNLGYLS